VKKAKAAATRGRRITRVKPPARRKVAAVKSRRAAVKTLRRTPRGKK